MTVAYFLSLLFSLFYGYAAAHNRTSRIVLMPLLDVLQSVPILSFLPVVLLSFSSILPTGLASELAAVVLIFTSQAWNMTFSFYQSMTTLPMELREAGAIFRFSPWLRFKTVELPFASIGLIWNSIMSWSGGWFFLMASEIFHVGDRDFRLPGLGSHLQTAASVGDRRALFLGLGTLVLVIILLDQFVWKPLLAWADKFKLEMIESDEPHSSWFLDVLSRSWLVEKFGAHVWEPYAERLDRRLQTPPDAPIEPLEKKDANGRPSPTAIALGMILTLLVLYGGYRAAELLLSLPASAWPKLGAGLLATFARVGVAIGMNRRLASLLQPIAQVVAAVPATALFPVLLFALLNAPGGLNLAAVALMLMGTQWYLLFNVIAGAAAIPQDLRFTTDLLRFSRIDRWRSLILPALFPYIVTGGKKAGPEIPGQPKRKLPDARLNALAGLVEKLAAEGGGADLYRISGELTMELDDLLPIVEACEKIGFVTIQEGDLLLTPLGQNYAEANILTRKELVVSRILRLPLILWIYETLQEDDDRRVDRDYFLDKLSPDFGDQTNQQLDIAINWGRYAELFAYDSNTDELYLES